MAAIPFSRRALALEKPLGGLWPAVLKRRALHAQPHECRWAAAYAVKALSPNLGDAWLTIGKAQQDKGASMEREALQRRGMSRRRRPNRCRYNIRHADDCSNHTCDAHKGIPFL